MIYYDTTSAKNGIVNDAWYKTNTDINTYPLADITRNINERYREVWGWIFDGYAGWRWDDSNNTNLPQAITDLTSGTALYALPSEALYVDSIEFKNTGGIWQKLIPLTAEQISDTDAMGNFLYVPGVPTYYRLIDDSIQIYPAPNFTQAQSLKVFFGRDISTFLVTDTTKIPGFAAPYHRALSVGAALDFAFAKNTAQIQTLQLEWQGYEKAIKHFYSERYKARFPTRMMVNDAMREFM